jgi:uncharacterized protein YjiS (DUF1127 family)
MPAAGGGVKSMTRMNRDLDDLIGGFFAPATLAATAALPFVGSRRQVSLGWALGRPVARMVATASAWHERARQRRALMQLSDHMLRDIGITRAEAIGEAGKPFWRV